MGALASLYIKRETLVDLLNKVEGNEDKGVEITISIDDTSNKYGQNVAAYESQSKEQRENKTPKNYIGNGKVFYTNGSINIGVKPE